MDDLRSRLLEELSPASTDLASALASVRRKARRRERRAKVSIAVLVLVVAAVPIAFFVHGFLSGSNKNTSGTQRSPSLGAWKTFTDPGLGWSMQYPTDWYFHLQPNGAINAHELGQITLVTNTDPSTLASSFNWRGLPVRAKLFPPSLLYVAITSKAGETTTAPSTPLPLSLPSSGQTIGSGTLGSRVFYEGAKVYTLVTWIGDGASSADLASAERVIGSLSFPPAASPPAPVKASDLYAGISVLAPSSWTVDWTGLPWVTSAQTLAAISSSPFDAAASCPKVPAGQVAIVLSDTGMPHPSAVSAYPARPATFSPPVPSSSYITKACREPQDSSVRFTQGGRYFSAEVLFGAGAYPARAADAGAVLNSLVIIPPVSVPTCKPTDIQVTTTHSELRSMYDLTDLFVTDNGPTCHLSGVPTLTIRSASGAPIAIPANGMGPHMDSLVVHGKRRLLGWWYFVNYCGGSAPLTYDVTSPWGTTSFVSPPLAPCGAMSGNPSPQLLFTKAGGPLG